jgi:polysaccharide export outer membrane protein
MSGPLRRLSTAAALLAALGALGCASTLRPPLPPPEKGERVYRVGPPDLLLVTIRPEPAIVREATVRPDGMISVDYVGDVRAAGLTPDEIADDIDKRIRTYVRSPQVTVALVESRSRAISIHGYVNRPATFPLQRDTRVSEALGLVAGPTEYAARSRIRVIRHTAESARVYRVDLDAIQAGDLRSDIVLEAGDIIFVPPTASASIGFAIRGIFFPLQQIFGIGGRAARIAVTGGF